MSRSLVFVILAIVVIVSGLFLLAGLDTERPLTRVEQAVSLENLAK